MSEQTRDAAGSRLPDEVLEAMFLLGSAAVGFFLNMVVIALLLTVRSLRTISSAFVLHGCLLDAVKCLYSIPFATSLLRRTPPNGCAVLGGSFVLLVTASAVNIVASICSEAYTFSEQNLGIERQISFCCILFGIIIVYVASIIIHLGPTIIGGYFDYNEQIGNCIFVYGAVKSYVVHSMWIAMMTVVIASAIYYMILFYRHLHAASTHRVASLLRAVFLRNDTPSRDVTVTSRSLRKSLSRCRALILMTSLFIVCWYPLYLLTLVDPKFQQSTKLYKVLSLIAWSNAALNPFVLLLFDYNVGTLRRVGCSASRRSHSPCAHSEGHESVYARVGCRLYSEGRNVLQRENGLLFRDSSAQDLEVSQTSSHI